MLPLLLFGVSILIFMMLQLLTPYERASLYVRDIPKQPGSLDALVVKYGLDRPIHEQYLSWAGQVLRGNLGFSRVGKAPVMEVILRHLPATLELTLWTAIPLVWVGIQLGVLSAVRRGTIVDHFSRVFAIVGWSFPLFIFGLLVLMIFYARLGWFPAGRLSDWANRIVLSSSFHRYTSMNSLDALLNGRIDIFIDALRHLVLPVITLSYLSWALILRVTRSSMLEALRQDFVTTARAKGLEERVVINRHVKPNAMIPVATIGGLTIVGLMNGVVITETVFNYRGMGWFFANSALTLDVISVLGVVIFNAVILVLGNLIVDVLYVYLDPRIRLT